MRGDVAAVRLVATIAPPLSRREGDNGLALGTVTVVQPERREGDQGTGKLGLFSWEHLVSPIPLFPMVL